MNNFTISTDKSKLNLDVIHEFLSKSYWSQNIPKWIVKKAMENSLCFGIYDNERQIGYARIISDYASFAYLADVFIIEEYRGKGLSKKLMENIMSHPELKTIRKWMLATNDAHGLYSQFGFTPLSHPEKIMEITTPDFYNVNKLEEPE